MKPIWIRRALIVAGLLALSSPGWAQTRVLITVDVESYSNGNPELQIWGRTDQGEHGITRIMDLLESHSMKATFFLTPYESAKHGEALIAAAARAIHERGHDLELHTHPGAMYGIGGMSLADLALQTEILTRGAEMLEQWTGKRVIAHRAGGFLANKDTLEACRRLGLVADSSLSPAVPNSPLNKVMTPSNLLTEVNGILEVPVTYYVQASIGPWQSKRIVDIEASTLTELRSIVRQARDGHLPTVNVLMHSFSFVRDGRVNYDVEERFAEFLQFLAQEPGITVTTVSKLHEDWAKGDLRDDYANVEPYTGWWLTYLRAIEDADKGYRNLVVAIIPPAFICVLSLIIAYWRSRLRRAAAK